MDPSILCAWSLQMEIEDILPRTLFGVLPRRSILDLILFLEYIDHVSDNELSSTSPFADDL